MSDYAASHRNNSNYIDNAHSLALLVFVMFVVLATPHMFSKIPVFMDPSYPTAIMAVLAGAIVALLSYLPIKFMYTGPTGLSNNQVVSMSVLLGVITTYFMVFEIRPGLPSVSAIALMTFMFYHHIDQMPSAHAQQF